ncbi:MAG: hypothetical protein B6I31_04460 [Desulfobacteraceae bacterium 4572_19]|nr:MAG: hypothetical protein B6I31_04460 [Desulfobacteraceae bacterium 4572_19]
MKKILIINGHEKFPNLAEGKFNRTFSDLALEHAKNQSMEVQSTYVDEPFDIEQELQKLVWADLVILQTPVYWFCVPGKLKMYIDQVFLAGYRTIYTGAGGKDYGKGGLLKGKYMLSTTWNAPEMAFEFGALMDGRTVDDVFLWLHKTLNYIGLTKAAPTFSCFDIVKNPNIDDNTKCYQEHLCSYVVG